LQEVVVLAPWPFQLWLVDVDCACYDLASTTIPDEPTSVHVPPDVLQESIATLRQYFPEATVMFTDLTEARPLIQTELTVKTHDGGQQISGLVDCFATLNVVLKDVVRRFSLLTLKSKAKTQIRLANSQRVTSSTVCVITFELAHHDLQRTFYGLRVLRAANLVLGLQWLDDEHAYL
jgi:hypothetical protein